MYKTTEQGVKAVMKAVGSALLKQGTLSACRNGVSAVLAKMPWLDAKMRSDVAREADALSRKFLLLAKNKPWELSRNLAYNIDGVMKAFNRSYRRAWKRTAKTYVQSQMKLQRNKDEPVVFYLVSSHQKPQPAHEPLQGTVLVDRFWREASAYDERVERYVKARKVRSVQWAMGAPHYLITRPNCRHYLIPLKTGEVVWSSLKELNKRHQKRPSHVHRPITEAQRWQAYKALRSAVLAMLENMAPAKRKAGL